MEAGLHAWQVARKVGIAILGATVPTTVVTTVELGLLAAGGTAFGGVLAALAAVHVTERVLRRHDVPALDAVTPTAAT